MKYSNNLNHNAIEILYNCGSLDKKTTSYVFFFIRKEAYKTFELRNFNWSYFLDYILF